MSELEQALVRLLAPAIERERGKAFGLTVEGMKHDVTGAPITAGYSHGPGGLLTYPGVDPDIFNAAMANESILGQLPAVATVETNPTYWTFTGVQDTTGSNKVDVCDDAPVAGLAKACLTTAVFGRYELATAQLELNRLGQQIDRADPMDLRLVGTPLGNSAGGVFGGPGNPNTPGDVLTNEISRKFWERNVAFQRLLAAQLWGGNPTNNTAGGGYKEFPGFSRLVNTGYVDAETGTACASVDSLLSNFANQRIDGTGGGDAIVNAISSIWFHLNDRARRNNLTPTRWIIAMRPQLFYELTKVWPCSYLTYRCQTTTNQQVVVAGDEQTRMRDDLRRGSYLLIDGVQVEVVQDDSIPETDGNESGSFPRGCFSSDIYFIPMSVVGGRAVTFMQYQQYSNPSLRDAITGRMVLGMIEGAFLTWPRQTNQCVQWQSKIEPRLIMRTPWLAARLQNVNYCPVLHTRDSDPDGSYHVDGGRTNRNAQAPSHYAVWKQ